MHELITILTAVFGGGGAGFGIAKILMENEAKKALKPDIDALHARINKIEDEFVTCKFCTMQHDNLNENLKDIKGTLKSQDNKLDTILGKL